MKASVILNKPSICPSSVLPSYNTSQLLLTDISEVKDSSELHPSDIILQLQASYQGMQAQNYTSQMMFDSVLQKELN